MAGKLTISTLNDSSGVLATQNGMTGIAKAWVFYNGNTQAITSSFNVSSVTYNSTGNYTVNLTTAMANANYSTVTNAYADSAVARLSAAADQTTTSFRIYVQYASTTGGSVAQNDKPVNAVVFSS